MCIFADDDSKESKQLTNKKQNNMSNNKYLQSDSLIEQVSKEAKKYSAEIKTITTLDKEYYQTMTNLSRDYNGQIDDAVSFIAKSYKKHQEVMNLDAETLSVEISTSSYANDPKRSYLIETDTTNLFKLIDEKQARISYKSGFTMLIKTKSASLTLYFTTDYPKGWVDYPKAAATLKTKLNDAVITYHPKLNSDSIRIIEFFNMITKVSKDEFNMDKWTSKFTRNLNKIRKDAITQSVITKRMKESILSGISDSVRAENRLLKIKVLKAMKLQALAFPKHITKNPLGDNHFTLSNRKVGDQSYANPYALQINNYVTVDELESKEARNKTLKCKAFFRGRKQYTYSNDHKVCQYQDGVLELNAYDVNNYVDQFMYNLNISSYDMSKTDLQKALGIKSSDETSSHDITMAIYSSLKHKRLLNTNSSEWYDYSTWFSLENNKAEKAIVEQNFSKVKEVNVSYEQVDKGWLNEATYHLAGDNSSKYDKETVELSPQI